MQHIYTPGLFMYDFFLSAYVIEGWVISDLLWVLPRHAPASSSSCCSGPVYEQLQQLQRDCLFRKETHCVKNSPVIKALKLISKKLLIDRDEKKLFARLYFPPGMLWNPWNVLQKAKRSSDIHRFNEWKVKFTWRLIWSGTFQTWIFKRQNPKLEGSIKDQTQTLTIPESWSIQ